MHTHTHNTHTYSLHCFASGRFLMLDLMIYIYLYCVDEENEWIKSDALQFIQNDRFYLKKGGKYI